jgi:hypothetical protein
VTDAIERLAAAGIQLLPAELPSHFVFERDGYICLVERAGEGFGPIGAPGLLTEHGFAVLVWRVSEGWIVAKGFEQKATGEQIEAIRAFAADLKSALSP